MDLKCTQCGGQVPIKEDTAFLRCPFCETALYVETDRTVSHQYLPPTVAANDLGPYLLRRLARFEYQDKLQVKAVKLFYFPVWRLDLATGKSVAVPAATVPFEDLHNLKMPAGAYQLFDGPALEANTVVEPEMLLEDAAPAACAELKNPDAKFTAAALVHLPFFLVTYVAGTREFRAMVDGASGEVYADEWPAGPQKQKDRALGLIAALCVGLFLIEAAAIPGFWLTMTAYAITAVGIYYLARSTLKRMGW